MLAHGHVVSEQPRYVTMRDGALITYHVGQLTVYLRLNDIPIPRSMGRPRMSVSSNSNLGYLFGRPARSTRPSPDEAERKTPTCPSNRITTEGVLSPTEGGPFR